jgi:hypothetical protein
MLKAHSCHDNAPGVLHPDEQRGTWCRERTGNGSVEILKEH